MKITRLKLKNWRNFRGVDCGISERTFVVGPNASGKSNLLDAFRFLRDVAADGGGLQNAVTRRDGFRSIRSLFTHGPKSHIELAIEAVLGGTRWTYELHLEEAKKTKGQALVRYEKVTARGEVLAERRGAQEQRLELRRQTHLEQAALNEQFEPLVQGLRTIRYAHLVPQLLRTTRLHGDRDLEPFGSTFLNRVYTTPRAERRAKLKQINEALRGVLPFFRRLTTEKDHLGNPHLEIAIKHWRTTDAYQDETELSDGTLRLIGLLWEVLDGDGPLLLEEPELSLHESAVRRLPSLIARIALRRQVILTTHAFSMFDDRGVTADEILLVRAGHHRSAKESVVVPGGTSIQIRNAVQHELSLGPELEAETRPPNPDQLTLGLQP